MSDDGPKIVDLPTRNELKGDVDGLRRKLPELIDHQLLLAKVRRAGYLAYCAEGFTEAQALELCKS